MKRLSENQIGDIIQRYQNGEQSKDIAIIYGIYDNSVARILRNRGIARTKIKRLSPEQLGKAVKMYVDDKISSELIAKQFGVDAGVVRRAVIKHGAAIRPATENKRQYKINDTFFEKIDCEANAYFLGLLYADGELSSSASGIRLELQAKDIDILEKYSMLIYDFLKIEDDPFKDENGNIIRVYKMVNVYSQKMHTDLIKLGCTPKKTFPTFDIVPENLIHHFIRGFMDGDGCICITDENSPRVDCTSTNDFLKGLTEYLINKLHITFSKIRLCHPERCNNTSGTQTKGFTNVRLLLDYLYLDATFLLNRKKDKYDEMLKQQQRKANKREIKYADEAKYGTTYIPTINDQQIRKEYLSTLNQEEKDNLIDPIFYFYREKGFPHTILDDDELIKDFTSLKKIDVAKIIKENILMPNNNTGTNIFKHFSPHFYEINDFSRKKKSMMDTFNDDDLLKKVIKNRLDQNFTLTGNELKAGLANSKIAFKASIFNCAIAKYIYQTYTKENDIIYDYSMGFGQRLLGALSLPYKITYIGIDPYELTYNSNSNIYNFYNNNVPMLNKNIDLRCVGSEAFLDEQYVGKIDLAFSSPPYYNLEIYSNDSKQAYYSSYVDFINKYWRITVSNINTMLAENGRFIINITNSEVSGFDVCNDMINVMKEAGFMLEREYKMQLSRNLAFMGKKDEPKTEPIYVFRKNS